MATAGLGSVVGRAAELDVLGRFVEELAEGRGGAILIEGEAGIGKSRLAAEAVNAAHGGRAGAVVLGASAEDLDRTRPFRTIAAALGARPGADAELAAIARMLGDAGEGADVGHRVHEACLGVIERSALQAPTLLWIEDAHWADLGTIGVLRTIGRQLDQLPIGLLVTARPHPRGEELQTLLDDLVTRGGRRLRVGPLDDDAACALVGANAAQWNARAGGNPFFLLELARTADDDTEGVSPADLHETVLRRIRQLPAAVVDLLQVASILGHGFVLTDLASVMRRPAQELVPLVSSALQAGFLVEAASGLRFRHDLIREALNAALPRTVAATLHLEAGWTLASSGAEAVRVAPHLIAGAEPGDVEAIAWLRRAGHQASRRNLATGLELLDAAADLASTRPDEAAEIEAETIPLMAWSGQLAAAIARGEALLRRPLPAELELDIHRSLAEAWALSGAMTEPYDHANAGLAVPDVPPAVAAELLAFRALRPGDSVSSRADLEEAHRLATGPGGTLEAASVVALIDVVVTLNERHLLRALSLAEEAVTQTRRAAGSGDGNGRTAAALLFALELLAKARYFADRPKEAAAAAAEARALAEGLGADAVVGMFTSDLALYACDMGQFDTALAEVDAYETMSADPGEALYLRYPVLVTTGEWDKAEATWTELEHLRPDDQYIRLLRARHLCALDREDEALGLLRDTWAIARDRGMWLSRTGSTVLIRLALADGDRRLAADVAAEAARLAAADAIDSLVASGLLCEALMSSDVGAAQKAVALLRGLDEPVPLALANADLARIAAAAGEPDVAAAAAVETLALLEAIGADPALARPLPSAPRTPTRKRPARPSFGWESLTATELRVVAALAEGLSNPQIAARLFVSRHTVESHLKHVFAKLGMSSRVELAAEAVRREMWPRVPDLGDARSPKRPSQSTP